ncbi:hypothetical protein [Microbacterium sp. 18062]|uniref:hypothetical protein n=1 Tax=Microbacterium sp. 18062 TaxID=2681410 RepID=UPI0013589C75|nr:hypothetical protein [Microbacterium sp. 18062]
MRAELTVSDEHPLACAIAEAVQIVGVRIRGVHDGVEATEGHRAGQPEHPRQPHGDGAVHPGVPAAKLTWVLAEGGNDAATTGELELPTAEIADTAELFKTTFLGNG